MDFEDHSTVPECRILGCRRVWHVKTKLGFEKFVGVWPNKALGVELALGQVGFRPEGIAIGFQRSSIFFVRQAAES